MSGAAAATRRRKPFRVPTLPRRARIGVSVAAIVAGALFPLFVASGGGLIDDATLALPTSSWRSG